MQWIKNGDETKKQIDTMVMNYTVEIDGDSFEVTLCNEERVTVSVSMGKRSLKFQINATSQPETFSVAHGNRLVPVLIENRGDKMTVCLGCRRIPVTVRTKRELLLESVQSAVYQTETQLRIVSPLPGLVTKVEAPQGSELRKGESIVIIEAMKMENEIRAPHDCTVLEINVHEGQPIDKGQVIALLK